MRCSRWTSSSGVVEPDGTIWRQHLLEPAPACPSGGTHSPPQRRISTGLDTRTQCAAAGRAAHTGLLRAPRRGITTAVTADGDVDSPRRSLTSPTPTEHRPEHETSGKHDRHQQPPRGSHRVTAAAADAVFPSVRPPSRRCRTDGQLGPHKRSGAGPIGTSSVGCDAGDPLAGSITAPRHGPRPATRHHSGPAERDARPLVAPAT